MEINLGKYKKQDTSVYTGRPQGEAVRKLLKLDELDTDGNNYTIIFPKNTTTINPSFFLGLFYKSISKLGVEQFKAKYKFEFEGVILRDVLLGDIKQYIQFAIESLNDNDLNNYF